jgi:hypothetical protein
MMAKDGWKSLEETETYVGHFSSEGMDGVKLTFELYVSLLSAIENDIIKTEQARSNPIWKNFANFVIITEEFLFYPTGMESECIFDTVAVHRDASDNWADFVLVQKLLDVFDLSLRPPNNDHLTGVELYSGKGKQIFLVMLRLTLLTFQEVCIHLVGLIS